MAIRSLGVDPGIRAAHGPPSATNGVNKCDRSADSVTVMTNSRRWSTRSMNASDVWRVGNASMPCWTCCVPATPRCWEEPAPGEVTRFVVGTLPAHMLLTWAGAEQGAIAAPTRMWSPQLRRGRVLQQPVRSHE